MKPYRVEWRPDLVTRWTLVTELDEHPGSLEAYVAKHAKSRPWTGCWRVVAQHVIEETGVIHA